MYQRNTHNRVIVFDQTVEGPYLDCAIDCGILNRRWREKPTDWVPVRLRVEDLWSYEDVLADYNKRLDRIELVYLHETGEAKTPKDKKKVDKVYLESLTRHAEALTIIKEDNDG